MVGNLFSSFFVVWEDNFSRELVILTAINKGKMAEFITMDEAKHEFASKGRANTGIALGAVGLGLGALNALGNGCGNGILGLGNWLGGNNCGCGSNQFAAGMVTGAAYYGPTPWEVAKQEMYDQEFTLARLGQVEVNALQTALDERNVDVAEKAAIYQQSKADNNRLEAKIDHNKDFTIQGLADVYQASVAENRVLERQISSNQLEAYKNVSDLYAATVIADKGLEIQIEKNREKDQAEKFALYKDLSGETNRLAFETMKQSYEDRMESMSQISALASRVCDLEKKEAVTSAQLPLMFKLSEANTNAAISSATCRKIDGNLTLGIDQLCNGLPQNSINALYAWPYNYTWGPMPFVGGPGFGYNAGSGSCCGNNGIIA